MDTKEIILDVKNLNTTFISDRKEVRIVKNVSFQLKRGTALAVVGESGCGKSVTMNSIMRFLGKNARVEADNIQYNALRDGKVTEYHLEKIKDPNGPEMRALRGPDMSMVFQDPMSSLNPVYKVGDQVAEGLIQHTGMKKKEARQKVLEMFRKLGIPDPEERIDNYPHQFSGGMKQRVVIAIAMICNPELIICDEPTTALDVTVQKQIIKLLNDLQAKLGFAMIFVSHDLALVAEVGSEITVMYAGQVIEQAPTVELLTNPIHEYTRGLLGSVLSIEEGAKDGTRLHQVPGSVPSPEDFPRGDRFAPRSSHPTLGLDVHPVIKSVPGKYHRYSELPDDYLKANGLTPYLETISAKTASEVI